MKGQNTFQYKGWSRNLKNKGLLFFVTLGLLVINTGCTQPAANQDGNPINQSGVIVGKMFSVAGPVGTVSITGTGPGISCQAANPQTNPPSLNCTANTAGVAELTVQVSLANGGTETWTSNITVNLPGSLSNDALVLAISQGSYASTVTTTSVSTVPQGTMNSPVAFDVSGSTFAKPADVTVTWNFGDGTTITTDAGVMSAKHTYTQPGKFEIVVSSNDSANGGNSIVQFDFTSLCDASVAPAQLTDISVTQEDGYNYYQYTATVTGGSGDYTTAWIPDGTGVYRNTVVGLTTDYYADYPGASRNVTVVLNDLACGTATNLSKTVAFNIPVASGIIPIVQGGAYVPQGPQMGNNAFIQGMLTSNAFPTDTRMNSMVVVVKPPSDTVSRISETYEYTGTTPGNNPYPGTFQISGFTGNPLMNSIAEDVDVLTQQETRLTQTLTLLNREVELTKKLYDQKVVPEIEWLRLTRQAADMKGQLAEVQSRKANANAGFRAQADEDMAKSRGDLAVLEENIKSAQDRVRRADLRSPVYGIVNKVNVTTIGAVVQPGASLMEIVPLEDTLLVEGRIRPQDIAFIRPEQDAVVKISAYDSNVYGSLKGKVERISADTIVDEHGPREEGKNETFYRVMVRTGTNHLGTAEHPLPILPGMVATVEVLTGHKTVLDYMIKPARMLRDEALRER